MRKLNHANNQTLRTTGARAFTAGQILLTTVTIISQAALAQAPAAQKKTVQRLPLNYKSVAVPDQVMVSAPIGTKPADLEDTLKAVNGTIANTIQSGNMLVYVINVPKGTLKQETLDKLGKDSHISNVQANMKAGF